MDNFEKMKLLCEKGIAFRYTPYNVYGVILKDGNREYLGTISPGDERVSISHNNSVFDYGDVYLEDGYIDGSHYRKFYF